MRVIIDDNSTKTGTIARIILDDNDIKIAALSLAEMYCSGWQKHGEHVGEMEATLTPKQWAECNFDCFMGEARNLLKSLGK